jgi:urease accessory protein UreH
VDSSRTAVRELSRVGREGRLHLTFAVRDGRTIIRHSFSEVPHKVTRLYYPDDSSMAQLILMNTTAGLFGGDYSEIRIHAESGARVLLTSQASTKVHPGDGVATQSLVATVESGAELHIYNDPLIPFQGAHLRQRLAFHIASDSVFGFWDGFMAGRVGRGERWEFKEIDTETRLSIGGKLAYLERYCLRQSPGLGDAAYFATGLFHLCELPDPSLASPFLGVDEPYPGLAVARVVAKTGPEYRKAERAIQPHSFRKQ